jgi:hypothetical protein
VISADDPGVLNWLDTGGRQRGAIVARWWTASSPPEPVVTRVRLSDVRTNLPAGTPAVTAADREASIRLRRKGAQLRTRW